VIAEKNYTANDYGYQLIDSETGLLNMIYSDVGSITVSRENSSNVISIVRENSKGFISAFNQLAK
jgi:hypothetical protein